MKKFRTFLLLIIALFLILTSCASVNNLKLHFMDGEEELTCISFGSIYNIYFPPDPEKEGYSFDAWYFDDGIWEIPLSVKSLEEVTLKDDLYVYAHWIEDTTIDDENENQDEDKDKDVDKGPTGSKTGGNLIPNDIVRLANLTNYGTEAKYYDCAAVTYDGYDAEETKLTNRINSKKTAQDSETSSIIKIFAAANAKEIISGMGKAALPSSKMTKVVNYLAGTENISEQAIKTKVDSRVWTETSSWSFIDDLIYYLKLKKIADSKSATSNDKDNANRQFRNIAGKVFATEMTGDEFARVTTQLHVYSLNVVMGMAGNKPIGTNDFATYCKNNLDYDTLVYLRAFNEYYGSGAGNASCVELYGYYYNYNKKNYDTVSDENFEKELTYSHYTTFTDAEWLEYVDLQRNNYAKAYRYSDNFYNIFYTKHFGFQEKQEGWEYKVFDFEAYSSLTYTQEMRNAITGNGLQGQLNMSDWMWCYSGNEDAMKAYNQANTKYENGKKAGAEAENEGKFYFEMEQLKIVDYILSKMTPLNLSGALRYQIYSYSGSMIQSISNNEKDVTLINDDRIEPTDVTSVLSTLQGTDIKNYAKGKVGAIIRQIKATYETVGVTSKAQRAANESWSSMGTEVKAALTYDYSSIASWEKKVERLEDLVIKRNYDCGVGLDDECPRGTGHAECKKVYDTAHSISQFVSNYEPIINYYRNKVFLSFQQNKDATANKANNYKITDWNNLPKTYNCGYGQASQVTEAMLNGVEYFEKQEISINRGDVFSEAILDADKKPREWWQGTGSTPGKATSKVRETLANQTQADYTYTYTFSGWYLDNKLLYKFDPNDTINCDLILYAGYNVTKSSAPSN